MHTLEVKNTQCRVKASKFFFSSYKRTTCATLYFHELPPDVKLPPLPIAFCVVLRWLLQVIVKWKENNLCTKQNILYQTRLWGTQVPLHPDSEKSECVEKWRLSLFSQINIFSLSQWLSCVFFTKDARLLQDAKLVCMQYLFWYLSTIFFYNGKINLNTLSTYIPVIFRNTQATQS